MKLKGLGHWNGPFLTLLSIPADVYPILVIHCEALEQDKANYLVLPLLLLDRS